MMNNDESMGSMSKFQNQLSHTPIESSRPVGTESQMDDLKPTRLILLTKKAQKVCFLTQKLRV